MMQTAGRNHRWDIEEATTRAHGPGVAEFELTRVVIQFYIRY